MHRGGQIYEKHSYHDDQSLVMRGRAEVAALEVAVETDPSPRVVHFDMTSACWFELQSLTPGELRLVSNPDLILNLHYRLRCPF